MWSEIEPSRDCTSIGETALKNSLAFQLPFLEFKAREKPISRGIRWMRGTELATAGRKTTRACDKKTPRLVTLSGVYDITPKPLLYVHVGEHCWKGRLAFL